jgi:hypothetical protein
VNHIDARNPLAVAVLKAIQTGDVPKLAQLRADNLGLSKVRLGEGAPCETSRTLPHVATDLAWTLS